MWRAGGWGVWRGSETSTMSLGAAGSPEPELTQSLLQDCLASPWRGREAEIRERQAGTQVSREAGLLEEVSQPFPAAQPQKEGVQCPRPRAWGGNSRPHPR